MIKWRLVPWPLWVYSAGVLVGIVLIEIAHGPIGVKVFYPAFVLGWLYFLLKGVRWVWIVTVGLGVLGFIPYLISGSISLMGLVWGLLTVVLLLLPVTRRYFSGDTAVKVA